VEKREFLFLFTQIYLSEAVKETILIENWEEGDFDTRYVEYADVFTDISKEYLTGNIPDKEIINRLTDNKNNLVNKFNETISAHFLKQLTSQPLIKKSAHDIIKNEIPLGGNIINPSTLEIFRKLEEKVYVSMKGDI